MSAELFPVLFYFFWRLDGSQGSAIERLERGWNQTCAALLSIEHIAKPNMAVV